MQRQTPRPTAGTMCLQHEMFPEPGHRDQPSDATEQRFVRVLGRGVAPWGLQNPKVRLSTSNSHSRAPDSARPACTALGAEAGRQHANPPGPPGFQQCPHLTTNQMEKSVLALTANRALLKTLRSFLLKCAPSDSSCHHHAAIVRHKIPACSHCPSVDFPPSLWCKYPVTAADPSERSYSRGEPTAGSNLPRASLRCPLGGPLMRVDD